MLNELTPWKYLIEQLNHSRYNRLDKIVQSI